MTRLGLLLGALAGFALTVLLRGGGTTRGIDAHLNGEDPSWTM